MGAGQGPSGRGRDCCLYTSKYVLGLNISLSWYEEKWLVVGGHFP